MGGCRLFCGFEDIYCLFLGSLNNLCLLNKQYGLTKTTNEAMFVIEAYRTLRDRGPYPADQVIKDLDGSFAFVVYDSKVGTVFAALVCTNLRASLVQFEIATNRFAMELNTDFSKLFMMVCRALMVELSFTGVSQLMDP